ncbi:MAG: 5-(carboxyamino)imidazole ribonucleotide synthase, partial [Elusimicrobiota bacterium]
MSRRLRPLPPGSTLGILGGGQLGRFLALEARAMGYRVRVLDCDPHAPCAQAAHAHARIPFDDAPAILAWAKTCDAVTYEFENVPARSVLALEKAGVLVRPSSLPLRISQDRIVEKDFAIRCGVPVAPFAPVRSAGELESAAKSVGFPALLKTARGGYDGKSQARVSTIAQARGAYGRLGEVPLIWEKKVDFIKEFSIVIARDAADRTAAYPASENTHEGGILVSSAAPARLPARARTRAETAARTLAAALDLVGVLCVEFFLEKGGGILLNELAPRPHNSGHYTLDACRTSQFGQQLRALCGLPLGRVSMRGAAAMVNILGEETGDRLEG